MCRVLAYMGEPLPVRNLLFDPEYSLVRQSYSPRMMNTFLNLAGFGMQAWDPSSLQPEDPFTYRTTTLPPFDRNLRFLASKLAPTCLVAHVRGVTYSNEAVVTERTGRSVGGSTGTNVWGSLLLVAEMRARGERGSVVTLICDGGDRYAGTYYNDAWVRAQGLDLEPCLQALEAFLEDGVFPA